jgi:predicted alpha/beta-fold hydrolase
LLSLGALLLERGYAVLRLNLRDHGPTHQLNRELFHSCRLPEVVGAVRAVAAQFDERLFLGGFSLGGNFLLRVAADFRAPAERVAVVAAVSPVLEPEHTLAALEHGWLMYRRHFIRLWSCSLRAKARAWPGEYDFSAMLRRPDLRRMTAELVRRCTDFPDLAHYLSGYAVTGARLAHLRVPARVLLAADDPIIPLADLEQVARSPELTITCTRYGGHCGFIDGFLGPSFADRFVLGEFERRE